MEKLSLMATAFCPAAGPKRKAAAAAAAKPGGGVSLQPGKKGGGGGAGKLSVKARLMKKLRLK